MKLSPILFNLMLNAVRETVEVHQTDFAIDAYWLQNTCEASRLIWAVRNTGTSTHLATENGIMSCEFYAAQVLSARFFIIDAEKPDSLQEVTGAGAVVLLKDWKEEDEKKED